ncbi:hypothetical protein [uncultured Kordia sp.]|uniref:hypothetical protein n=1 Tax=uncultured Kordia sp. TaxID=507699 RepID=UPI00261FF97C|nr:hypothetical protein [uncultured Kordia sp.]
MYRIQDFDVKSELLQKHWELINVAYGSLVKKLKENENDTEDEFGFGITLFDQCYDIIFSQWREIYPKFVLHPIRDEVLALFLEAQTTDLKLKKPSKNTTKVYSVYYYVLQYFAIGIQPYHDYDEFPDLSLDRSDKSDDLNLLLYNIFETIWYELKLDDKTEEDIFDDKSEFYDLEVDFLSDFLSKCWNETKAKTNTNVIGILDEATACGITYSLDENKPLKDSDEILKNLI